MPETQRSMLKQSFRMESEQLEEMANDEALLTPDLSAKNISKQYIQDLFRFFKLFPQHTDFYNIFSSALSMNSSYLFDILSANSEIKADVAEYYFAKSHYKQALELFEDLLKEQEPTAAIYQKTGYSYQQTSQLNKALEAYLKADIIQPDDLWTIRKIALCYKLSGNHEKALEFYQHADFLKPDQTSTLLHIGQCLVVLERYKEALLVYSKLDTEDISGIKAWRAIVWCAFVSGNIAQADYYSQKILEHEQLAQDLLNAGHIAWCQNKRSIASEYYLRWLQKLKNKYLFENMLKNDIVYLSANGIDSDVISLMIDQLLYNEE